jgi:triosephosphate isomerase
MRRKLIAGNWKMNGLRADGTALAAAVARHANAATPPGCDLLVCPPFTLLDPVGSELAGSAVMLGGQDCHPASSGPHTGDISAVMLKDAGCSHVILGHSERRADHGEDDALIRAKAEAALAAGLIPVICIGETEAERDAGRALDVAVSQLRLSMPEAAKQKGAVVEIAYEPVWAIGTGRTPSTADVAEMHGALRRALTGLVWEPQAVRLLYGGSVKPSNAAELMAVPDVDGALVGGASLKAEDFWAIAQAAG